MRGYCRGTSVRDPGKERLDDRGVDAVELLVLERSDRRGDIDGRSESRFLRRSLFRCVFEPRRGDSLNGNESLRTLLIVAEGSGQDLGEPVVGQANELTNETQRVEHAAIELVGGGDEVAEEDFQNVALTRFGRDQVVQLDIAGLADPVDATHPLFEPHE